MRFRLEPKSMTLDDLELLKEIFAEFCYIYSSHFWETTTAKLIACFWDTATYWLKIAYFSYPSLIWKDWLHVLPHMIMWRVHFDNYTGYRYNSGSPTNSVYLCTRSILLRHHYTSVTLWLKQPPSVYDHDFGPAAVIDTNNHGCD